MLEAFRASGVFRVWGSILQALQGLSVLMFVFRVYGFGFERLYFGDVEPYATCSGLSVTKFEP